MNNHKYTERVNKVAEELAREYWAHLLGNNVHAAPWDKLSNTDQACEISDMMPLAKMAMAMQAEAIRQSLYDAPDFKLVYSEGMSDSPLVNEELIDRYLIDNGYVPKN